MGYTIFERKTRRMNSPSVTITTLGRLALNKSASQILEKQAAEAVVLMWDPESRKFAIRPFNKKDQRSYKLAFGKKGNGAGFSAVTFLDHIGCNYSESIRLPAVWNEQQGLFEVEVPEQYLKGMTLPLQMEGAKKHQARPA